MFDQYPTPFLRSPEEAYDLVVGQWYNNFQNDPGFRLFEDDDTEYTETILSDLTGFMLYYQDCLPTEWTVDRIEHCLMIDFPRSLYRDGEYIYSVPVVLTQFFHYLENSGLLSGAADIARYIDDNRFDFYAEMDEPDSYSMRKGLLISAEDEGIDTDDETAVLAYLEKIGDREMDGVEPEVTDNLYFVLSSWVVPFSDSRYITLIDTASGQEVIEIITTLAGVLIQENKNPHEWSVSDLVQIIEEVLIPYPMTPKKRELFIPVIHAFFTFLAEEDIFTHAQEIAEAILPLHDRFVSESSSNSLGIAAEILLNHLFKAGVDVDDESAVDAYVKTHKDEIVQDLLLSGDPELMKEMTKVVVMNPDSDKKSYLQIR